LEKVLDDCQWFGLIGIEWERFLRARKMVIPSLDWFLPRVGKGVFHKLNGCEKLTV